TINLLRKTINLLRKAREAQSATLDSTAAGCQATVWDISDTHRELEEAADAEEGGGDQLGGGLSISAMAGAVGRGGAYAPRPNQGSGSVRGSNMSGPGRASSSNGMSSRRETMQSGAGALGLERQSSMIGGPNQGMQGGQSGMDIAMDGAVGDGAIPEPPNPLLSLHGLSEALDLMDAALAQNTHLPKLLAYRGVAQLAQKAPPDTPPEDPTANSDALVAVTAPLRGLSRAMSRSASRPLSRQESQHSVGQEESHMHNMKDGLNKALSARVPMSKAGSAAGSVQGSERGGNGGGNSTASMWPDELLQDLADLGPDGVPRLELLWEWKCAETQGQRVACMAWNKKAKDMLAVGYGNNSFDVGADHSVPTKGLVAFWSLKNPGHPLWMFETPAGVTSLDFAHHSPNILAVGLYNGAVAIYDIQSRTGLPSMEADAATGRHGDPVWKVRWLDRGHEREEPLVSVSTDGRVTQWSIAKGLEFFDLMRLKRVARRAAPGAPIAATQTTTNGSGNDGGKHSTGMGGAATANGESAEPFISRLTSGMAFDFSARDERIYIAATEDGWIHRCSTSYAEQYLESYQGHMGPVYNVQWSPFRPDMFISASADWTLRLWQEGQQSSLLLFNAGNHEVNDVQWCPTNSTVFGDVTTGGRLELWDVELSTVKPVVTFKAGVQLSCLLFAANSPVVVCGGEGGSVQVLRTHNIDREYDTAEEQVYRLDETIRANVMKQKAGEAGGV
ncbi:hypothetical protein FOA52_010838, partial [Chlamydomonas sp. UWO 241]